MIEIHRLAFRELRDARRYSRSRSVHAADRFERDFDAATVRMGNNPEASDLLWGDYRAVQFKTYRIIFSNEPDGSLLIVAVAHDRRRPDYWRHRRRTR